MYNNSFNADRLFRWRRVKAVRLSWAFGRSVETMELYHFIIEEYGLEAIAKQRLKASSLDNLNDPFELYAVDLSSSREFRIGAGINARALQERLGHANVNTALMVYSHVLKSMEDEAAQAAECAVSWECSWE